MQQWKRHQQHTDNKNHTKNPTKLNPNTVVKWARDIRFKCWLCEFMLLYNQIHFDRASYSSLLALLLAQGTQLTKTQREGGRERERMTRHAHCIKINLKKIAHAIINIYYLNWKSVIFALRIFILFSLGFSYFCIKLVSEINTLQFV